MSKRFILKITIFSAMNNHSILHRRVRVMPTSVFLCVCMSVHTLKHEYLCTIQFDLMHHWCLGKAALGFGPDRIRTLVSMAANNYDVVIMGKIWLAF